MADNIKAPTRLENMAGWGVLGSGLGGMLGQGFGRQNYMDASNPYYQQMQGGMDKYLEPYINAGKGAMGTLQDQYQNLLSNPGQMYNQMGAGYQQSPGYQHNVNEATRASNNAAAAGGFIGSPQQQADLSNQISGYASQDYNQYMNNLLGLYGQGLGGMGNINQMGYGASNNATQSLNDMLTKQAELAYSNASNNQSSTGGMFSGLGGLAGGALGFLGGGPGGALAGWKLGNKLFE